MASPCLGIKSPMFSCKVLWDLLSLSSPAQVLVASVSLHVLFHPVLISTLCDGVLVLLILQMRKLKLREVKQSGQSQSEYMAGLGYTLGKNFLQPTKFFM